MLLVNLYLTLLFVFVRNGRSFESDFKFGGEKENAEDSKVRKSEGGRFSEFRKMAEFLEPLTNKAKTKKCRNQMKTFVESLSNSSLWAVQMLDASAKLPQGLLSSDAYDLGNYDECLEINLRRNQEENVLGKYCLAKFSISRSKCRLESRNVYGNPKAAMLEHLIVPVFRYGFINNAFRLGICVPHECSSTDVEIMLRFFYRNVLNIDCEADVSVPENACTTAEISESKISVFIRRVFAFTFLGVVIITILDVWGVSRNYTFSGIAIRYVLPFSAYRNYNLLISSHNEERILVLDALRIYSLVVLTTVRRFDLMLRAPIQNRQSIDESLGNELKEKFFYTIDDLIIATLFVVSGFLHFRKIHKFARTNPGLKICRVYLVQFLKIIPLYVTAVFFQAFALEHQGDGPLWKERTQNITRDCRENLGSDSFSLGNFFKINEKCIFESWYFTLIVPYIFVLPIVVGISKKNPAGGLAFLIFSTAAAAFIPISGITVREYRLIEAITSGAFSYIVGVGTSLLQIELQEKKWRIPDVRVKFISIVTFVLFVGFFSQKWFWFDFSIFPSIVFQSTSSLSRQYIWTLIIAYSIISVSTNQSSWLAPFLKHEYLTFFASFSYSYLLSLGFVQNYTTWTTRTLEYFSYARLVWMSSADLVATFIVAFVFYMVVHKPASVLLEGKFLKKKGKNEEKQAKSVKKNVQFRNNSKFKTN